MKFYIHLLTLALSSAVATPAMAADKAEVSSTPIIGHILPLPTQTLFPKIKSSPEVQVKSESLNLPAFKSLPLNIDGSPKQKGLVHGGSNGGGGNSTPRSQAERQDLKHTIEITHKLSRFLFTALLNMGFNSQRDFDEVLQKIQRNVMTPESVLARIELKFPENQPCKIIDDRRTSAYFKDDTICFDLDEITTLNYSKKEAEAKIAALYFHELAHAAGYSNAPEDEALLRGFQLAVETDLANSSYSLENYEWRLKNPLNVGRPTLRQSLEEFLKPETKSKSLLWICLKLHSIIERMDSIPVSNRQESGGLSLMTAEDESLVDLLSWELSITSSLSCDGMNDEVPDLNQWIASPRKHGNLRDAIYTTNGSDFCGPYYSSKVCETAQRIQISTKPLDEEKLKAWARSINARILSFLDQPKFNLHF